MATRKKAKGNKVQPIRRGTALTIWLALLVIQSALGVILILELVKQPEDPSRPYLLTAVFLLSTAKLIGVFGMWLWRKWGIYTYTASVIGVTIIGLMLTGSAMMVFYELLPVAITGWLLGGKMSNFR